MPVAYLRLLWVLLLIPAAAAAAARPAITDVRLVPVAGGTRVVLQVSQRVEYRLFALANPDRLVLDFPELDFKLPPGGKPGGSGVVGAVRYGLFTPGTSRLVLDLAGPAAIGKIEQQPPAGGRPGQLVLELKRSGAAQFDKLVRATPITSSAAMQAVVPTGPAPPPIKPALPKTDPRRLIVLDPGHGGVDPGTIGASGTLEKNVTLAMAKELKRQLEATGVYKVVMTRDSDVFIPLQDRTAIARAAHAEMFISLHADAHEEASLRGASIYTLSEEASDAEAAALAAKENKSDVLAGVDLSHTNGAVSSILIDLAQRDTKNRSAELAGLLVQSLKADTTVLRRPHRQAGFVVLKAPDIPSVLIELGYLSSRQDEANLNAPKYRAKLARAILRSIDGYFDWQDHAKRS
jgi:N-acetylmuramoyl-L-alanine amidase